MRDTRSAFADLRNDSKQRAKERLKGSMHAVRLAVAAKNGGSPWGKALGRGEGKPEGKGRTRSPFARKKTLNGFDIDKLKAQIAKEREDEGENMKGGGAEPSAEDQKIVWSGFVPGIHSETK